MKNAGELCKGFFNSTLLDFKLYQHRPQISQTNLCVINVQKGSKRCSGERCNTLVNFFSQWHPAIAPQQWHTAAPSNGIQPWHPTMAPSNGTPAMAPSNGTQQWHPSNGTPAMAPSNGTPASAMAPAPQHWHRAMAPNVNSAKVGS